MSKCHFVLCPKTFIPNLSLPQITECYKSDCWFIYSLEKPDELSDRQVFVLLTHKGKQQVEKKR
jgi:hypothetical protein